MEEKSMTALVSLFARAYHNESYETKIFADTVARKLITDEEYKSISDNMTNGINFFCPEFKGSEEDALRYIVNNQLSPSPLGRQAFCESSLHNSVKLGARQYLVFAAGYDSFAYRQPQWAHDLEIFEIDHPLTAKDKQYRIKNANITIKENTHYINADFTQKNWENSLTDNKSFIKDSKCFCSLLGLTYYLTQADFENMLDSISDLVCEGSEIVFDYPVRIAESEKTQKQKALARGANEKMLTEYTYEQLEKILEKHGYLIYEHLNPKEITNNYFEIFNSIYPQYKMKAFDNVNYCMAVKK